MMIVKVSIQIIIGSIAQTQEQPTTTMKCMAMSKLNGVSKDQQAIERKDQSEMENSSTSKTITGKQKA
jgi:hypothetical protein